MLREIPDAAIETSLETLQDIKERIKSLAERPGAAQDQDGGGDPLRRMPVHVAQAPPLPTAQIAAASAPGAGQQRLPRVGPALAGRPALALLPFNGTGEICHDEARAAA